MVLALAITFGIIAFVVSYLGEHLHIDNTESRHQARSFGVGFVITYIFLELIPHSIPDNGDTDLFFFFILLGFVIFHLLEKYIYQHAKGKTLRKELREEHMAVFSLYHILVGMSVMFFLQRNIVEGIFFFIPLVLHDVLSSASIKYMYTPMKRRKLFKFIFSATTLVGIFIGYYTSFSLMFYQGLIGLMAGSLLHVVVRDVVPDKKEGVALFFVLGVMTMIGFLTVSFVS